MDLKRKLEIVQTAIKSISEHTDVDSGVRLAALAQVGSMVEQEKFNITTEVQDQISELHKKA